MLRQEGYSFKILSQLTKNKVDQNYIISDQDIVNDCILIQKGKNYFLLKVI